MSPAFDIGFISIHWYSIILFIAILIGGYLVLKEIKKKNFDEDIILNLLFFSIIWGLIGARIYFVLFNLDYYFINPIKIFTVWEGGLAVHGGIIAGLIFILYYTKKYKLNSLLILDILAVGLIIAQGIGRWGNFINQEAYGPETTLINLSNFHIPKFIINGMYIDGSYYIPTFLLESIGCLIGFIILLLYRKSKRTKIGQIFSLYLIIYGIIRFFVESLRTDSLMFDNFKIAQIISLIMILIGLILFIKANIKGKLYNEER